MEAGGKLVRVEREESGLAVVTLDSPPLNLFERRMFDGLVAAVDSLEAEPPRGLLIRAEGEVVSGGVDVHEFAGLTAAQAGDLWDQLLRLVGRVERLPLPTIFAAHALTLTAAFELALSCDLIAAARSARFGLVERVVGLTPSMGGTQRLAERAGSARAAQLVMSGDLYDAVELERWGVVNFLFDDDAFDGHAHELATDLATGPTRAHAMTKHILRRFREGGIGAADEAVRSDAGELFASEDLKRAVSSFLEHGPGHAEFEGR
jgi:enoyl-CoA hydratase/carnithine racemase